MSDNENDAATRAAVLAARTRRERAQWYATFKRLVPLVAFVVLAVMYGSHNEARADEAPVTPPQSVSAASAPVERQTVTVELPEFSGDSTEADMLVEIYAHRLIDNGFVPARGCDCLTGPADVAAEVRHYIDVDYPGLWQRVFQTPAAPVAGQQI